MDPNPDIQTRKSRYPDLDSTFYGSKILFSGSGFGHSEYPIFGADLDHR